MKSSPEQVPAQKSRQVRGNVDPDLKEFYRKLAEIDRGIQERRVKLAKAGGICEPHEWVYGYGDLGCATGELNAWRRERPDFTDL